LTDICKICGLPKDICVCQEIAKEKQKIKIHIEKRQFGKVSTILEGFSEGIDLHALAKELKKKFACGGTYKNNRIELQGDHKEKAKDFLVGMGYNKDQIDVR
jgi:translation initiation factor 1